MKYRIEGFVEKIICPVTAVTEEGELVFKNGAELYETEFDKRYLVDNISAKDNMIYVVLKENDSINTLNWTADNAVTFF